ncbi:GGDEF domain-containing protein [Kineococcus glutinatus]|uniref:GGDEF domain-containing protein n=1 Tax=Kineococcus glutinatus TaxID=1070872 RepID=UPI0031EDCC8D
MPGDPSPRGGRRRPGRPPLLARLLPAALLRPLATDEARARFWVRHLRMGVALSCLTALVVAGYALASPERPHRTALLVVAVVVAAVSPLLLRLPMQRMALDHRGRPFFYGWTLGVITVLAVMAVVDSGPDGSGSLVRLTFVLALIYATVAYPPLGIVVLGSVVVAADLLTGLLASGSTPGLWVSSAVLATCTWMAWWAARNQHDLDAERSRTARRLADLANTDPLTGCLNRRAFWERLDGALPEPAGRVLHVVDLDGFKQVNDTAGHATGDELLVAVAAALGRAVGEDGVVARLGGDEFALLSAGGDGEALAARVRAEVAAASAERGVTASVGWSALRADDTEAGALRRADRAMYAEKARHRAGRRDRRTDRT